MTTETTRHTPLPIVVQFDAYYPRKRVAVTYNAEKGFPWIEANTLACLIAAAPEIVEALKALLADVGSIWPDHEWPAAQHARALLRRIDGGTDG